MRRWLRGHWFLVYFLAIVVAFSIFVSCAAPQPITSGTPIPVTQKITKYQVDIGVTCYVYNEGLSNASMSCVRVP